MEDWEGESDCERAKEIECQLYAEIYHDRFGSLDDVDSCVKPFEEDSIDEVVSRSGSELEIICEKPTIHRRHSIQSDSDSDVISIDSREGDSIAVHFLSPVKKQRQIRAVQSCSKTTIDLNSATDQEIIDSLPDGNWDVEDCLPPKRGLVECTICRQTGHRAIRCRNKRKITRVCHMCAAEGHTSGRCPVVFCNICMSFDDHRTQHCPRSAKSLAARWCTTCKAPGHDKKSCPSFIQNASPGECVLSKKERLLRRSCFNCGSSKHFGSECDKLMLNPRVIAFPSDRKRKKAKTPKNLQPNPSGDNWFDFTVVKSYRKYRRLYEALLKKPNLAKPLMKMSRNLVRLNVHLEKCTRGRRKRFKTAGEELLSTLNKLDADQLDQLVVGLDKGRWKSFTTLQREANRKNAELNEKPLKKRKLKTKKVRPEPFTEVQEKDSDVEIIAESLVPPDESTVRWTEHSGTLKFSWDVEAGGDHPPHTYWLRDEVVTE